MALNPSGATLTFDAAGTEPTFPNSDFALDDYPGGRAYSLRGPRSLVISLPLAGIDSLEAIGFDLGSSGTGPKAFALSFSAGGQPYQSIADSVVFEALGDQALNRYDLDLSAYNFPASGVLHLRLDFLPGPRPVRRDDDGVETPVAYNPTAGTVRIDNIRIIGSGSSGAAPDSLPDRLRYLIFSAADGRLVQQRELAVADLAADGLIDAELPTGTYDAVFVAYRTDQGILLPDEPENADGFYFGQRFDDHRAVTYAVRLDDVPVDGTDREVPALLERCYSLVEFRFTDDPEALRRIDRIEVTRDMDDYLYVPFGMPGAVPMPDVRSVSFDGFGDSGADRVALHQFLGRAESPLPVAYTLTAYDRNGQVLRAISLTQEITANVYLRLTGRLLGDAPSGGFAVEFEREWDEVLDRTF